MLRYILGVDSHEPDGGTLLFRGWMEQWWFFRGYDSCVMARAAEKLEMIAHS